VRFGVFQRPGKLTAAFWDAAADVLLRTPRSRVLVHYLSADLHDRCSRSSRNVLAQLARRGVAGERIDLCGALPMKERLELLSQVDIALDTFPYNGQTTTCECLWMGVPVITLYGHSHVGRVGGGLLRRIGLGSFVAESPRDYVDIAAGLAQDRIRRDELRSSLRAHLLSSTLMKPGVVTADAEAAYRALWHRWCSSNKGNRRLVKS
jgi:predicted O-linked N-acetylglucosamine transferase (SPINDLY family)